MNHKTMKATKLFIFCLCLSLLVSVGTTDKADAHDLLAPQFQSSNLLDKVEINFPDKGTINVPQSLTATVTTYAAYDGEDIKYSWYIANFKDFPLEDIPPHIGGETDTVSYEWDSGGFKLIEVKAEIATTGEYVWDRVFFPVEVPAFLSPPFPLTVYVTSAFDHHSPEYEEDQSTDMLTWEGARDNSVDRNGHNGIDYGFGYLPIYAAAASREVVHAGWDNPTNHNIGLGLYVKLRHQNGYYTIYGHLNSLSVKSCVEINCPLLLEGDVIGISGDTGSSSNEHLHFEVRTPPNISDEDKSYPVDPYGYNPTEANNDVDRERPAWRHTQPNSLWLTLPDIGNGASVYPDGTGNALELPDLPATGVVVDDYAHLLPDVNAPNFSASPNCWGLGETVVESVNAENDEYLSIDADEFLENNPAPSDYIGTCWARWYLPEDQPSGEYSIYVHVPWGYDEHFADNVLYRVIRTGSEIARVPVSQYGINNIVYNGTTWSNDPTIEDGWVYIGNYFFPQSANSDNYIEVTDRVVGETVDVSATGWGNKPKLTDTVVAVDAVKFVRGSSGEKVETVLIIDSSGSMVTNDPNDQRLLASRFFVTNAAIQDDYIGIVDFDGSVRIATSPPLLRLHINESRVINAINTIDSSGLTNIGLGIQTGCEILNQSARFEYKKGAILLTDGEGGYSGQDACFSQNDWPIYAFGFGNANDTLLNQIAYNTGGSYTRVNNLISLTCEFIRVRSLIANIEPPPCAPYTVAYQETITISQTVAPQQEQATFSTGWPGSDVEMTLTSPSGRVIDRDTVAPDVLHENGATYEVYTITNPEAGEWTIELYGADVPVEGEEVIFGFASVPAQQTGEEIFSDNFESGDLSAWSNSVTDNGNLSVVSDGGSGYVLEALVDDQTNIYVEDDTPASEARIRARFYLNPNTLAMNEHDSLYVLWAEDEVGGDVFGVQLNRQYDSYWITAMVKDDAGIETYTNTYYLPSGWSMIEVDWQAASAPGADDGSIALYVNDALVELLSFLDNDTHVVGKAFMGVLETVPATTSGTIYFDDFVSRKQTYIGLEQNGPAIPAMVQNVKVSASADDAEECLEDNSVDLTSSDLEMVYDDGHGCDLNQEVGMRFTNLDIPQGATVTNAYIQFQVNDPTSETTTLTISAQDSENAAHFSSTTGDVSSRAHTTASVSWTPPAWPVEGTAGLDQRTPDLTAIIQEVVDHPGWSDENAIVLLINGSGVRTAESYDGESYAAPLLHVEWTQNGAPLARPAEQVFADGYESTPDPFAPWSEVETDNGDLSVSTGAAAVGTYGAEALIDDTNKMYTRIYSGEDLTQYTTRFYFDINTMSMEDEESHYIFYTRDDGSWMQYMKVEKTSTGYFFKMYALEDNSQYVSGQDNYVDDDWNAIELTWKRSSGPGANDGFLKMYVNDSLVETFSGLDDDTITIDEQSIGLLSSIEATTSGMHYFDAFEFRRGGHVGLDPNGPSVGMMMAMMSIGSPESGLKVEPLITDTMASAVNRYRARFYIDPNTATIPAGESLKVYDVQDNTGASRVQFWLHHEQGKYWLQPQVAGKNGKWEIGDPLYLVDSWNAVEIDWQAASMANGNDGYLNVWVNGKPAASLSKVQNGSQVVQQATLGVLEPELTTATGIINFDWYAAGGVDYIGLIEGPVVPDPN